MGRSQRRSSTSWKTLDVGIDTGRVTDANHYDDEAKLHPQDLEADPCEGVGMFYGLEVLDGSQYEVRNVTGSKVLVIREGKEDVGEASTPKRSKERDRSTVGEEPFDKEKKNKRKKKQKKSKTGVDAAHAETSPAEPDADDQVPDMQQAWQTQTGGVTLHEELCRSLVKQNFWTPTPIQAATLPAAILGRRNLVGAAPTGSGKTLSFLLPICQFLLEEHDPNDKRLKALILAPTRELALQIQDDCKLLLRHRIGAIVGGLALAKQARVLNKLRPPVIVGTPGRLWELMASRDYEHLIDLSQIRFLVIDEADRMVAQNSFPQLERILDAVQLANPMDYNEDSEDGEDSDEDMDPNRLLGLPGIPGEAKLAMLSNDILKQIKDQQEDNEANEPETQELNDTDYEAEQMRLNEEAEDGSEDELSLPPTPPVFRQTFVYSATLTLPASGKFVKSGKRLKINKDVDGAIAKILEKSRAKGPTKVVDLTNADKTGRNKHVVEEKLTSFASRTSSSSEQQGPKKGDRQFRLPQGLTLQEIKCSQQRKDSYLYAYLETTEEGKKGPALVFCNSIAGVRRVGKTLETLGLPVRTLHAHMQQRARLKAVDSLKKESGSRPIVVATDVAARGLSIDSITTVVHYDTARTVDAFVHRSGRTAISHLLATQRGVGDKATGHSLSLISPAEENSHSKIVSNLEVPFYSVDMDGRMLRAAQERASLASKVVVASESERRVHSKNQWFKEKAADAGLDLEDELLEEGLEAGGTRERGQLREAQNARYRLSQLLAEPMKVHRFGKFLSSNPSSRRQMIDSITARTEKNEAQARKKPRR